MLKSIIKTLCIGSFAMMLPLTACDPDITPAQVRNAIIKADFRPVTMSSAANHLDGTVDFECKLAPRNPEALKIEGEKVKITKVEFFFDDELISTDYDSPYECNFTMSGLSPEMHKWTAKIYGKTCDENETTASITISDYDLSDFVDYFLDYNFVGEGDTFTISGIINPEKSAKGIEIKSFKAFWDSELMGTTTSAPFSLSHVVKDAEKTKHTVKTETIFSNGQTSNSTLEVDIIDPDTSVLINRLMSSNNIFKQSNTLRTKAILYKGKNFSSEVQLDIYFDGQKVASTKTYPYIFEKSLQNVSKGTHTLATQTTYIDINGREHTYDPTNQTITVK